MNQKLLRFSYVAGLLFATSCPAFAFKDFGSTVFWKDQLFIRQPVMPRPVTWHADSFDIGQLYFKGEDRVVALAVDPDDDTAYMLVQSKPGLPAKLAISGRRGNRIISLPEDFDTWERRNWLLAHGGQCVIVSSKVKAYILEGEKWQKRELECTESAEFLRGQPQNVTLNDGVLFFNYWGGDFGSGVVSCNLKDMKWCIEDTRFRRKNVDTSSEQMFDAYQREMIDSSIRDYVFDDQIWGLTDREILHKIDDKWISVAALPDNAVEAITSIWRSIDGVVFASTGLGNVYQLEKDTLLKLDTKPLAEFIANRRAEAEKAKPADQDTPPTPLTTRLLAVTDDHIVLADAYNSLLAFDLKNHKVLSASFNDEKTFVVDAKKLK